MHESSNGERTPWVAQAAKDWETFLMLRARELKPGGKMMISTMSRDDAGYSWKEFSHVVWHSIQKVHSRGKLLKREVETLCIPACLRSESELLSPFARKSQLASLFEIDSLQFFQTEVDGERALPTKVLGQLIRRRIEAVWGGMFIAQLEKLGRTNASANSVMNEVWDLFEEEIAKETGRGWLDMRFFCLEATRRRAQRRVASLPAEDGLEVPVEITA
jgi:hypothetical protein